MLVFDWDAANVKHLNEHRVSPKEFEAAFRVALDLDSEHADGEERYHAVGMTEAGRLLYMVWTPRNDKVRAVTAFTAPYPAKRAWRERTK